MSFLKQLHRLLRNAGLKEQDSQLLPVDSQIRAWRRADRKMSWGIPDEEFNSIGVAPALTDKEKSEGFKGLGLFYGFGDDGSGNADPILSAKEAWEYAGTYKKKNRWQCEYIDFERVDDMRLRPGAPARPRGFYISKVNQGDKHLFSTVSQVRKSLAENETGFGHEGLQLLAVTHRHFQSLMNEKKMPFMALADYDVAPYGYNDFYDAPQIFHSIGVLGLGIGHVDRNYPLFGIPTLRFITQ